MSFRVERFVLTLSTVGMSDFRATNLKYPKKIEFITKIDINLNLLENFKHLQPLALIPSTHKLLESFPTVSALVFLV